MEGRAQTEPGRRRVELAPVVGWLWPLVALFAIVTAVVALVGLGDESLQRQSTFMLIDLILVVGLYTFVGNSGVLSFGHISFMAIGAYATSILTIPATIKASELRLPGFLASAELPTVAAIIVAAAFASMIAYVIAVPLMRLSGLSAGIATLAVLVITQVVMQHWDDVTHGQKTLYGIPADTSRWGSLGWALAVIALAYVFQESRYGIRLQASREDAFAAQSVGVNIGAERRLSFALSAGMVAIGGGLWAHFLATISPDAFYFDITFITFAMLVVGGINSLSGAVIGTIAVSVVRELLRRVEAGFSVGSTHISTPGGTQDLILAFLMLLVLLFLSGGITGSKEIRWPLSKRPERWWPTR